MLPAAAAAKSSILSDSVRPHRWQPTRLPCPWDSPGKNTGVGCHFLLPMLPATQFKNLLSDVMKLEARLSMLFVLRIFFVYWLLCKISPQIECSCLENLRDRGAWWASVYGVAQSRTWLKPLSSSSSSNNYSCSGVLLSVRLTHKAGTLILAAGWEFDQDLVLEVSVSLHVVFSIDCLTLLMQW